VQSWGPDGPEVFSVHHENSGVRLNTPQFIALAVHLISRTTTFSSTGRSGLNLEIEVTASYTIRLAAITLAVAMTAIVHGTMLAGFDHVAQQAVAQQSASANAVALQKVTVTAHKS
jgi:hypothetical protein